MAIEDSNPERRNLTVMSAAIIMFYLADGQFANKREITLEIIDVTFNNASALTIMMWFMLFWFAFRYWIENKNRIMNEFYYELNRSIYLSWFINSFYGKKLFPNVKDGFNPSQTRFVYYTNPALSADDSPTDLCLQFSDEGRIVGETRVDAPAKYGIVFILLFRLAFTKRNISANIIPLFLFMCAVLLGIINSY